MSCCDVVTLSFGAHLVFAGLARDCGNTVEENVSLLLSLAKDPRVNTLELLILENDSRDDTKQKLHALSRAYSEITLFTLPSLDQKFPCRVERIAYCRQYLLDYIRAKELASDSLSTLYIPVDLDSEIVTSINSNSFISACLFLISSRTLDALFPVSKPFYYDILALRAPGWCGSDCIADLARFQAFKSHLVYELARLWLIVGRQKSFKKLALQPDLIAVESAFGGFGIYSINSIQHADYHSFLWPSTVYNKTCEHVLFNQAVANKAIDPRLVVSAPLEHLHLGESRNILSLIRIVLTALLLDITKIVSKILRLIASLAKT